MTRRAARATQEEIERAIRAASVERGRTGEPWRVRVERDGAIVLEPFQAQPADPWAAPQVDRRREIDL
jgi:hypothetical protein